MNAHTRQANMRQAARDNKPQIHDENRVTKTKRNDASTAMSDFTKATAKTENFSSASTSSALISGAKDTSGQKVYSSVLNPKPSNTMLRDAMAALAPSKPCLPLASINIGRTRVSHDPASHVSRPCDTRSGASGKPGMEILPNRNILNRTANSAAAAAVPQKIKRSASSSDLLPPKPINPRILASKPSASASSGKFGSIVTAGYKRCAAPIEHESGRAVRPKVARETSHIVRANSASDSEISAASQETFVEHQSSHPIESDDESEPTVVSRGVPADIIRRRIAQPGPAFSSRYSHRIPYPFEKDFDADKKPAVKYDTEPDWDDFDAEDADDPSMVTEYIDDIIKYLREREAKLIPDEHYMDKQAKLNWAMRYNLVDWIINIHNKFGMLPETLFHAVNLIDRYLSENQASTTMLQLIGLTALLIACKYEQRKPPSFDHLAYISGDIYTVDEIKDAELYMLRALDFDLSYPGPFTFLRRISRAEQYDIQTRTVAKYIMEVCIMDHRLLNLPPSLFAAAGICLARRMLDAGPWDSNLRHYSGYTEAELQPCINIVLDHIRRSSDNEYINQKYMAERFFTCSEFCRDYAMENAYRLDFSTANR